MWSMLMLVIFMKVCLNDIPHVLDYELERSSLVAKYGSWAVGRAESVCPFHDAECVRREAARLQRKVLIE